MGMIYRKAYTMPVPAGAEIVEQGAQRIARWRLRNGQLRSAEVVEDCKDDKLRVRGQSRFFMARYRDGSGRTVEISTNCKDPIAARAVLTKLERKSELVRAGVMSPEEDCAADHAGQPLSKHLDAYVRHLQAKGGNARRIGMVRRRIERVAGDCRFTTLGRMSTGPIEKWLVMQADAGLSAATRNGYRESLVCFGNWCRRTNRLTVNPFTNLPRADQNANRKHHRRALTEQELLRLLEVARKRPLAEYGRAVITKQTDRKRSAKSRATWTREPLTFENIDDAMKRARDALADNPDLINELEQTGQERALIYKTLVLTGMRKGELASLTVFKLNFDGPVAYAALNAEDEKNRQGSSIPLRADLAAELSLWIDKRLNELQAKTCTNGKLIPMQSQSETRRNGKLIPMQLRTESRTNGKPVPIQLRTETRKNGKLIPMQSQTETRRNGRSVSSHPPVDTRNASRSIPARLPPSTPLFRVPSGLARILDRDLAVAGIPKRDERNRVVDVHALRVTFGTHLCAAGVPLRTAQAAMRHSKPELTANVYTDPKLLDIAGAINALPTLSPDPKSGTIKACANA